MGEDVTTVHAGAVLRLESLFRVKYKAVMGS